MTTTVSLEELPGLAGRDLGWTGYREVAQDQVNTFADATDDHQWIHVDPERAANGPFRAPIAHGFLTVSLAIPFWSDLLEVTGAETKVNYGLDKVRFVSPVRVGAKIRMKAQVTEISGGFQIGVDQVIEADGETKPAVVAHSLYRFYA